MRMSPIRRADFVEKSQMSARLIGLAESNHGTQEFVSEQVAVSLELARKYGFQLIMIEAGYGEALALERYVNGLDVDVVAAIGSLGYWTWNTQGFLDALSQIRAYNQSVAPDRRVHLVGVDIQSTEGVIADLVHDSSLLSAAERALLEQLRPDSGKQWPQFSPEDKDSVRATLNRIAGLSTEGGVDAGVNQQALSAHSLLLQLGYVEKTDFWDKLRIRDRAIADMIEDVMKRTPGARGTVWSHIGHLSRGFVVGAPTAGRLLADSLGAGYRVYVLLANSGAARARAVDQKLGVIAHPLAPAPAYTLEGVLASRSSTPLPDITFWSFDGVDAAARRWLHELHWIRSFGAVYGGEAKPYELYEPAVLDGAILFKTVSPSVPLKN